MLKKVADRYGNLNVTKKKVKSTSALDHNLLEKQSITFKSSFTPYTDPFQPNQFQKSYFYLVKTADRTVPFIFERSRVFLAFLATRKFWNNTYPMRS